MIALLVAGMLHVANEHAMIRSLRPDLSQRMRSISSWRRVENSANRTICCIGIEEGRLTGGAEVLHQSIQFVNSRSTIALSALSR